MSAPEPDVAGHPMAPRPFRIRRKSRETDDAVTLALDPVDGRPLTFRPGQFNMLYAFGIGEVPISMSSDCRTGRPLVHTVRAVGAVSRALSSARRGDVIGVRGPFGNGWLEDADEGADLVLMGGGIGLAPLRSALLHALHHRRKYGRITLLVGARTPDQILFPGELNRLRSRTDLTVMVTVDRAARGWQGEVGVVTELLPSVTIDPASTLSLVCGPEVMMRLGAEALAGLGIPASQIRVSLERNMKCAIGWCGHCQIGPVFVCGHGPVFSHDTARSLLAVRER